MDFDLAVWGKVTLSYLWGPPNLLYSRTPMLHREASFCVAVIASGVPPHKAKWFAGRPPHSNITMITVSMPYLLIASIVGHC